MYRLPEHLRPALAAPLGPVLSDADGLRRALDAQAAGRPVVAIGDVTTARLVAGGVRPRVAVVDGMTKRGADVPGLDAALARLAEGGAPTVRVRNPAAAITEELWTALAVALAADGASTVVVVDGEEDLAALPAALLAPAGALVCYGQPDRGLVVLEVDDALRARIRDILNRMET